MWAHVVVELPRWPHLPPHPTLTYTVVSTVRTAAAMTETRAFSRLGVADGGGKKQLAATLLRAKGNAQIAGDRVSQGLGGYVPTPW